MVILITGSAGFIGHTLAKKLKAQGEELLGVDNVNDYYFTHFKRENINEAGIDFVEGDIRDIVFLEDLFSKHKITSIVHLAAMVGVRPSIQNPFIYEEVNVKGTLNLLELAKKHKVQKFVFASSSSVYGDRDTVPFKESDATNSPISAYAATKKSGELLCYTYSSLYHLPCVCLRFFTVYGPRGRPDMAPYKFVERIAKGEAIEMYGDGSSRRDYTYVDDVADGIIAALHLDTRYEIINLGCGNPVVLKDFIATIEEALGKKANIIHKEAQQGDVQQTYADISKAQKLLNYHPKTNIKQGIRNVCEWYLKSGR